MTKLTLWQPLVFSECVEKKNPVNSEHLHNKWSADCFCGMHQWPCHIVHESKCSVIGWLSINLSFHRNIHCTVCQPLTTIFIEAWSSPYSKTAMSFLNALSPGDKSMCQRTRSTLLQIIACRQRYDKPLPEPMMTYCQMDTYQQAFINIWIKRSFFEENAFENVVCKMLDILFRPQHSLTFVRVNEKSGMRPWLV